MIKFFALIALLFSSVYSADKVVVTGGCGFIGSHLVDKLIRDDFEVHIIDNFSTGFANNINPHAIVHNFDLSSCDISSVEEIFSGAKYVFHMAALARVQPSIKDPLYYHAHNVDATLKVLQAAYKAKVSRVIYSSSSAIYGESQTLPTTTNTPAQPLSPYGLQKWIGEEYCKLYSRLYGLSTVSLRYFNVYGERMNESGSYCTVMGIWANQIKSNRPITITNDGEQKRDYVYVGDVVDANCIVALSNREFRGEVYNIGSGISVSINQLAKVFKTQTKFIGNCVEPRETLADISKTSDELGWHPKGDILKWASQFSKKLHLIRTKNDD